MSARSVKRGEAMLHVEHCAGTQWHVLQLRRRHPHPPREAYPPAVPKATTESPRGAA